MSLRERIKKHEGLRKKPYQDSEGIWTVGIGRNLEAVEFTDAEIELMFENDLRSARQSASRIYVYEFLNAARQGVLIEMVFQMGYTGVSKFKNFLTAALQRKWQVAHDEMLDSKWAKQTPGRAKELAAIFLKGAS